jgi:hypothetical protein
MNIEELRVICLRFPSVTEDIKWENNLVAKLPKKVIDSL